MTEQPKLGTLEEQRGLGDNQLIDRINGYLRETEQRATDASLYPLRAQILIQELTRRDQDKQALLMLGYTRRMVIYTVVVTIATIIIGVMTGIQLVLAFAHHPLR
jgi:hypothetical protein